MGTAQGAPGTELANARPERVQGSQDVGVAPEQADDEEAEQQYHRDADENQGQHAHLRSA